MKKYLFSIVFFLFFLFSLNIAYGSQNDMIRVGLEYKYKNVSSVEISNNEINFGFEADGSFLTSGELKSQNGFCVKPENKAYIKLTQKFKSYYDALNSCQKIYGQFSAYPALNGNGIYSVYVGAFNSLDEANRYMQASQISAEAVVCGKNAVDVYASSDIALISDSDSSLQIKPTASEPIALGERSYRGVIEFINNSSSLTAVNVVDTEEYLYSAVGSEMPEQWHIEALKAQAVACRSYCSFKRNTHIDSGYDICDASHCQLYKGALSESQSVTDAVNQTKGIKAYYDDKPINAVYCSSNGGYSADSKSVWNYECDYLKAVEDFSEKGGKVWSRSFTQAELSSLAGSIGTVTEIISQHDAISGRVNKLTLKGTSGEKVLEGESIRTFFASSAGGSLESRNFTIGDTPNSSPVLGPNNLYSQSKDGLSELSDNCSAVSSSSQNNITVSSCFAVDSGGISALKSHSAAELTSSFSIKSEGIVFNGKGWGHGVGMSQFGAKSMAENGFTYDQILKHYYTGIILK